MPSDDQSGRRSWEDLFARGDGYDLTLDEVRAALRDHRENG